MCFKRYQAYICGHCSYAFLQKCPLTLANPSFPPCPHPAEMPHPIHQFCHPCARIVHNSHVIQQEEEHKARHANGDVCCGTVFNADNIGQLTYRGSARSGGGGGRGGRAGGGGGGRNFGRHGNPERGHGETSRAGGYGGYRGANRVGGMMVNQGYNNGTNQQGTSEFVAFEHAVVEYNPFNQTNQGTFAHAQASAQVSDRQAYGQDCNQADVNAQAYLEAFNDSGIPSQGFGQPLTYGRSEPYPSNVEMLRIPIDEKPVNPTYGSRWHPTDAMVRPGLYVPTASEVATSQDQIQYVGYDTYSAEGRDNIETRSETIQTENRPESPAASGSRRTESVPRIHIRMYNSDEASFDDDDDSSTIADKVVRRRSV